MTPYRDIRKQIRIFFILGILAISIIYIAFRAYPLISGPAILLYSPYDGDIVASTTFELSGQVTRAKEITVQGKPITIDTEGRFTETLIATAPHTIITVQATDSYGKHITKTITVIPK